ncbi:MAG: CoA transferase [Gammaproteobacteria bacterium]|nr:CoA transferase [Gammaproteobacteria bacterium]
MNEAQQSPLAGLKVLDLSRILAGPWASQLLGDLGADVVKVERPGAGDDTRKWGPPYLKDRAGEDTGEAAYYLCANRNKRSLALDISIPEGQAVLRRMAALSDVLIENFRVGTMARFGLDYPGLSGLNPRLVYCSITAFGQQGPEAAAPGYDAMIQARGGLMSITGVADGEPGEGPQKVGVAMADLMTGMYATSAIQAALLARTRSGLGQYIDLALYDSQVAMLANQASNYLVGGVVPGRLGTAHPNIVPYQAFATADGHLMLAVGNDLQFERLLETLGLVDLVGDSRYATNQARTARRGDLVKLLQQKILSQDTAYWSQRFTQAQVPFGPINRLDQVFDDPQARHRGLAIELPHALAHSVPSVANPIRFSGTPVSYRHGPPVLGQHSREILVEWLGMDESDLDALAESGVI